MFCPKCGNQLTDIFVDKCLSCGMNFKNFSLSQRQSLFENSSTKKNRRPARLRKYANRTNVKPQRDTTLVRIEYNNGYAIKEGMSKSGRKLRKGSFKKKPNNEGTRSRFPIFC